MLHPLQQKHKQSPDTVILSLHVTNKDSTIPTILVVSNQVREQPPRGFLPARPLSFPRLPCCLANQLLSVERSFRFLNDVHRLQRRYTKTRHLLPILMSIYVDITSALQKFIVQSNFEPICGLHL